MLTLHEDAFDRIYCLAYGNLCRDLELRILDKDLERIGESLRLNYKQVMGHYL